MGIDTTSDDDPKRLLSEIAKFPTDVPLRFRLGSALCKRQDYSGAVSELRKAMLSPHVRLQAMKLLVEAYQETGQTDLAVNMREQLSRESGEDPGSASASIPAPTRPISPQDMSDAKEHPHEDDAV